MNPADLTPAVTRAIDLIRRRHPGVDLSVEPAERGYVLVNRPCGCWAAQVSSDGWCWESDAKARVGAKVFSPEGVEHST